MLSRNIGQVRSLRPCLALSNKHQPKSKIKLQTDDIVEHVACLYVFSQYRQKVLTCLFLGVNRGYLSHFIDFIPRLLYPTWHQMSKNIFLKRQNYANPMRSLFATDQQKVRTNDTLWNWNKVHEWCIWGFRKNRSKVVIYYFKIKEYLHCTSIRLP